jgi:hypothetical protein
MTAPESTLPTPPQGEHRWSVITIARYLCIAPHAAHAALEAAGFTEDESGFTAPRYDHSYDMPSVGGGASYGDVYLTDEAAEHLLDVFPFGALARAVVNDEPVAAALLGWDQIYGLAAHLVEHHGGGLPAPVPAEVPARKPSATFHPQGTVIRGRSS